MIIDGNATEKKAMEAFLRGDSKEGSRIQDEFIAELKDALKTQDHCTCEVKDCKFHGKCMLCVLIHRGHRHHLPNCFRDMVNEKISIISELTEHTLSHDSHHPCNTEKI